MFSPSDFNAAVPQFTNGNYAQTPLNPLYVEEPGASDYIRGVEPLQTLPAQWWNWLANQFTSKFNKLNVYVKNIFDELTQLLSLVGITPDATEGTITTGQLKTAFEQRYPNYLSKFIHSIASIWTYTGTTVVGDVTTTQTSRLAVFEHINTSDASTTPPTETDEYNTKYIENVPIPMGGTGASTAQTAIENLCGDISAVTPVLPTDEVVLKRGANVNKANITTLANAINQAQLYPAIVATSQVVSGPVLNNNGIVTILFTNNIVASDDSTGLALTYNDESVNVVVNKDGTLSPFTGAKISWDKTNAEYRYLDAYVSLRLYYDGTQFVILDNPVVLKNESYSSTLSQYSIHADGSVDGGNIGDIKPRGVGTLPYGWLECDGSAQSRNLYSKLFDFFSNETYDGTHTLLSRYGAGDGSTTFNLPDTREAALTGLGQRASGTHDVFTVGEFKDFMLQNHGHSITDPGHYHTCNDGYPARVPDGRIASGSAYSAYSTNAVNTDTKTTGISIGNPNSGTYGTVTRGKRFGAKFIIKVI